MLISQAGVQSRKAEQRLGMHINIRNKKHPPMPDSSHSEEKPAESWRGELLKKQHWGLNP